MGSLKADKWCTIITVYLPLPLVSLCGDGMVHKSSAIALQLHEALDHTMALVSAVHITCARLMTREHAFAYQSYMAIWLSRLKAIHTSLCYISSKWPHGDPHPSIPPFFWPCVFMVVLSIQALDWPTATSTNKK